MEFLVNEIIGTPPAGPAEKVRFYILEKRLIPEGSSVLLSISAGKDSMAMLSIISGLKDELSLRVYAFHLNHKTRNGESDSDARFVAESCSRAGVHLFSFEKSFAGCSSFEESARNARYSIIEDILSRENIDLALTAHTMSDNAETVLMRVLGGTAIHGLCGISPRRGKIVRPMLCLSSSEVYDFCSAHSIGFCHDRSNDDTVYLRNFVRNVLLKDAPSRFPDYEKNILRLSGLAEENERFVRGQLAAVFDSEAIGEGRVSFDVSSIEEDEFLIKAFLSAQMRNAGCYVTGEILNEALRNLSSAKRRAVIYSNSDLTIEKNYSSDARLLSFFRGFALPLFKPCFVDLSAVTGPSEFSLDGVGVLKTFYASFEYFSQNKKSKNIVFLGVCGDEMMEISRRGDGDFIVQNRMKKKLKSIFIDNHFSQRQKEMVPVIRISGVIAAVCCAFAGDAQNRVADFYAVDEKSKKILAICRE